VADCLVSDKCAAGSGRILQIIAKVLGITIEEMGKLSLQATQPAKFTTGCAVFLETEAISRVAEGTAKEDIIAGLHHTLAARIGAMAQRMRVEDDCAFTGGGAVDIGLVKIMEKRIGKKITTPEDPLITAAIGAALIAAEK
jgi:predicted CoA-substrate-specific enzyme activase